MLDFSNYIDLPMVWYGLIATAIFLYVVLDGFDLGVGILFPFAPSDQCRDRMMASIAPFWDGNETWLVLGGGGLFAVFPLAYSILMPAFYIPITLMLLGLIMRGVSFEFRYKASDRSRKIWDYAFHFGSLIAAFTQGMMIGAFVQGVEVTGRQFSGGQFDWLNAYSVMTGLAVVCGYGLLGATWLIMKTEDVTQSWARKCAGYLFGYVAFFMAMVSLSMPIMDDRIRALWFSLPNFFLPPDSTPALHRILCLAVAGPAPQKRMAPLCPEPRHLFDELHRARNQSLAVAGALRSHLQKGCRRTGVPVPAAGRHRCSVANGIGLHRILLLCVPRKKHT